MSAEWINPKTLEEAVDAIAKPENWRRIRFNRAQDRLEQTRLLLREAEILREAAEQNYIDAYSAFLEARVLAQPQFNVEPLDERSVAERYADKEAARLDRTSAP